MEIVTILNPPSAGALHESNKPDTHDCDQGSGEMKQVKDIDNHTPGLDPQIRIRAEKALTRKLDLRLMPVIILLSILNFIDRSGLAAARLQGLEKDLGLSGIQYNVVIAIFAVTFAPMQIPSNMILNKISRPSIYIGMCVILWGIGSALTGLTKNYAGIMICRVFLGLPEAAFYPGIAYLLSRWYTRKQLAFRTAVLGSSALGAAAFANLIAAAVLKRMQGVAGLAAWRWLFILEGTITTVFGLAAMLLLPDYPHNTRWLSPSDSHLAQTRMAEEAGETDNDTAEESAWAGFKMAIMDAKVLLFMLMACPAYIGGSHSIYFPTLTANLGFSTTITLLLAAPPWIIAMILCLINALSADRTGERFVHFACWEWLAIVGYIIALSTTSIGGRYFALYVLAASTAGSPMIVVWVSNTISRPPSKRAAAIAIVNGFGSVGALMGSFVWPLKWGPAYRQSMLLALSAFILSSAIALLIRQLLVRENRILDAQELPLLKGPDRERVEEFAKLEGISFEDALVRKKGFRYLY